ncbi:unnamed protein product [Cunninghamella blakesleeana]
MPKLDNLSFEEMISISKKMYYGGFFFLPLLWLVNYMYFFQQIRKPDAPKELKQYCYRSLAGCIICFTILTAWYATYVNQRTSWGGIGDKITVVIPKGK